MTLTTVPGKRREGPYSSAALTAYGSYMYWISKSPSELVPLLLRSFVMIMLSSVTCRDGRMETMSSCVHALCTLHLGHTPLAKGSKCLPWLISCCMFSLLTSKSLVVYPYQYSTLLLTCKIHTSFTDTKAAWCRNNSHSQKALSNMTLNTLHSSSVVEFMRFKEFKEFLLWT